MLAFVPGPIEWLSGLTAIAAIEGSERTLAFVPGPIEQLSGMTAIAAIEGSEGVPAFVPSLIEQLSDAVPIEAIQKTIQEPIDAVVHPENLVRILEDKQCGLPLYTYTSLRRNSSWSTHSQS
jgi:hypothetical protein